MQEKSDMFNSPEYYLMIIAIALSASTSIILILVLKDKIYKKSKLMIKVTIAEVICICSSIWFLLSYETKRAFSNVFWYSGIYRYFPDNEENVAKLAMDKLNFSLFYSFQTYSILMTSFICLEIFFSLKYPISQMNKRLKIYIYITYIGTGCQFILLMIIANFSEKDDGEFITQKFFHASFGISFRVVNLIAFLVFVIIGGSSIVYLVQRFCKGNIQIARDIRNKFVAKHCCFVGIYFLFYFPLILNELLYVSNNCNGDKLFIPEVCLFFFYLMPFAMFFVRSVETTVAKYLCFLCNKNQRTSNVGLNERISENESQDDSVKNNIYAMVRNLKADDDVFFDPTQPLTSSIFKSLNYEFMCCILSGLRQICERSARRRIGIFDGGIPRRDNPVEDYYGQRTHHKIFYKFNNEQDGQGAMDIIMRVATNTSTSSTGGGAEDAGANDSNEITTHQDAVIIEYSPKIFREIRLMDGVTPEFLANSLDIRLNEENIKNIKESEGKSGSFFFFTHDQRFIIKTLTKDEKDALLGNFLKNYHEHLKSNTSFLTRIYGVYEVIVHNVSELSIILLQNLQIFPIKQIEYIFDLKGSMVGRFLKEHKKTSKLTALKDKNLLMKLEFEKNLFNIADDKSQHFASILQNDVKLLSLNNLMDYSLLLLIVKIPPQDHEDYNKVMESFAQENFLHRLAISANNKYTYCFGIIDYLQSFNLSKLFENKFKGLLYGSERNLISAVEPVLYADRMVNFMRDYLFK